MNAFLKQFACPPNMLPCDSTIIDQLRAEPIIKVAELKSRGQIRRELLEVREDQVSPDSLPLFF